MLICQEIDNQEMRTCEIKSRKVAKCIEMLFFSMFGGSGGSESLLAKAAGAESSAGKA
jgi:hypothetical protein